MSMNIKEYIEHKEANRFAMELLMPKKMVKDYIDKNCNGEVDLTDLDQISSMARKFNVDQAVLAIRLVDLGYAMI